MRSLANMRKPLIGLGIAVIAIVILELFLPRFLTVGNLSNVLVQAALVAVAAFGVTIVLLTAGIDLSVGGVMSLTGVVVAVLITGGMPWPAAILIGVLLGLAIGTINGAAIAWLNLPPFIATFGTSGIAAGLALYLADAYPIKVMPDGFIALGNGSIARIPFLVMIAVVIMLILEVVTRVTPWGINLRATGNAPAVAKVTGVPVRLTILSAYMASGTFAACAGTLLAANLSTAGPLQGSPYTLTAIAACVIGGVDLFGGKGHLWAAALGTIFLAVLRNVLNLIGVAPFTQNLVLGCLIILAVVATTRGPALRAGLVHLIKPHAGGAA